MCIRDRPIVGERVDAHKFIPQVMKAGALATLSERVLDLSLIHI